MQPHDWFPLPQKPFEETNHRCRRCGLVALGGGFYRDRSGRLSSVRGGFVMDTDGAMAERLADGSPLATVVGEDPGCPDALDAIIETTSERRSAVLRRMRS